MTEIPLRPELELLLLSARPLPKDGAGQEQIRKLLQERNCNWQELLKAGEHHRLRPFLHHNLKWHADLIPAEVISKLQETYLGLAFQNQMLAVETRRIFELFAQEGIDLVVLKGAPLAELLHGHPALRETFDIDILCRPEKALSARRKLVELGYQAIRKNSLNRLTNEFICSKAFDKLQNEWTFSNGEHYIDLHWGMDEELLSKFKCEWLFENSQMMDFAGGKIKVPTIEALLPTLILHSSKHLWERISWIGDIARLFCERSLDWSCILADMEKRQEGLMLALAAELAAKLPELQLDPQMEKLRIKHAKAKLLAHNVLDRFNTNLCSHEARLLTKWQFWSEMAEGNEQKIKTISQLIFQPKIQDWQAIPLPESFHFLYPALRPGYLAFKHFPKAVMRALKAEHGDPHLRRDTINE
ncbi:MAG: nucleotidyltransferase family protein [Candidatus Obscuribacterales bacterium]|nr:nucleotidyltransferase family protein [Candidatus Obscuribacterales bacterium]